MTIAIDIDNLPDIFRTKEWHLALDDFSKSSYETLNVFTIEDERIQKMVERWKAQVEYYNIDLGQDPPFVKEKNPLFEYSINISHQYLNGRYDEVMGADKDNIRLYIDEITNIKIENNIDLLFVIKSFQELTLKSRVVLDLDTFVCESVDSIRPYADDYIQCRFYNSIVRLYCVKIFDFISKYKIKNEDEFSKICGADDIKDKYRTTYIEQWYNNQRYPDALDDDDTPEEMLYDLIATVKSTNIMDLADDEEYDPSIKKYSYLEAFLDLPVIVEDYEWHLLEWNVEAIKATTAAREPTIRPNTTFF